MDARSRIGIVGPDGAGRSTLLGALVLATHDRRLRDAPAFDRELAL